MRVVSYRSASSSSTALSYGTGFIHALLREMEMEIRNIDQQVTAFNVGINIGNDAGQTVSHMHVHLIPRRHGDVKNPRGGVRGVIPDKQDYS
jgi:diadenosine tetraphosphate (Ap4A) HIT family hydrolase